MRSFLVLLVLAALAFLAIASVQAHPLNEALDSELAAIEDGEVEWVTPSFIETEAEEGVDMEAEAEVDTEADPDPQKVPNSNPASDVAWEKPTREDINHQDHRRVHVTVMANHLDIAAQYNNAGDGVGVRQHVDAASKHNKAAVLHRKADTDVDFIQPAIKASNAAWKKSRGLLRRIKKVNMRPKAEQSDAGKQGIAFYKKNVAKLAPESLEKRQDDRLRGRD